MNNVLKTYHVQLAILALCGSLTLSSSYAADASPQELYLKLEEAKENALPEHPKISQVILNSVSNIRDHVSRIPPEKAVVPLNLSVYSTSFVHVNTHGYIQVYIYVDRWGHLESDEIKSLGVAIEIVNEVIGIVQAWAPYQRLEELSQAEFVTRITPPVYGESNSGSVVTEGDAILLADDARGLGFDGSNVKVGVISGGVDGLSSSQSSGDLPSVEVIQTQSGNAEGTAMLEIVHDIAPGATLGFCGLPTDTTLDFMQCLDLLRTSFSADIIVDDIGFFGEPYFEDGIVADAVKFAVNSGVFYVSSSGNNADKHYQAPYLNFNNSGFHNFGGRAGSIDDTDVYFIIPPGETLKAWLQWNEPFGSSCSDYDLLLFDQFTNLLALSTLTQNCNDNPLEFISFTNPFIFTISAFLAVYKNYGNDRILELFYELPPLEYIIPTGSVIGHSAVTGVMSVGAINATDPGHDTIAPYSSWGNSEIYFPIYQVRGKPNIVAIDDVSVTGAGGFPTPFTGTSAAAPHVAGIAALLKSAVPSASAFQIYDVITSSATDLGSTSPNTTFGYGLVNALAALQMLADEDNDGILFGQDNCPSISNTDQLNTDGDSAGDACDTDDDNDGVSDDTDIAQLNPDICADSDNDSCDDCVVGVDNFGPQPDNTPSNDGTDTDLDGLCNLGDMDDDNDGLSDEEEIVLGTDPLNPDTDNDGLSDVEEINLGTDPLNPDTDNDGHQDDADNCPIDENTNQIDTDSDAAGDVCDDCPNDPYDGCNQICFPVKSPNGTAAVICF